MEIRYSWGTGAADGQPREMSVPDFDTFEKTIRDNRTTIGVLPEDTKEELDAKKRRLPYIWHEFKNGAARRRRSASAGNLCYLPLDLDGVTQNGWDCIQEILSAYRGFAYTTASHTHPVAKGEYRIRIILAPSRAVSPAEKQPLLQTIQSEIMSVVDLFYDGPAKWDDSVYRPAQMVFLPDERAQFWSFTGQAVDVDTLLVNALVPIEIPDDTEHGDLTRLVDLENINSNTFDDLRSALWHPGMLQHAENYPTWAAMGNRLAWFKDTDHEEKVKALWIEWSTKAIKGDPEAAANKWEQLTADRTGYQSIFSLAQKAGWTNPGAERFQSAVACVDDFEDVTGNAVAKSTPLPSFKRDKWGQIEATIENAFKAVIRSDFVDVEIRFDQFRDEIMFAPAGTDQWQTFGDADYARLRITLEKRSFKPVGRELIRDSVLLAADENPFDSAIAWLNGLKWDGVSRIERFYHTHLGAEDTPFTRAVSKYMWTALAGRVLKPGIKADMVPVWVGKQGCGKSSGVAALVPDPSFFTEISFAEKDDDLARKMRGRLVAEISELRGLNTKEQEAIKAFVTRTHENWIPKYREFATQFPRRTLFVGTTNEDEFLDDKTDNRRWLPVEVKKISVANIKSDLLQLWAEAKVVFEEDGILFRDAERLAAAVHEQYTIKDVWLEMIERWLDTPDLMTEEIPRTRDFLRAGEVLREALNIDPKNIGRREEMRISKILLVCGYKRVLRRISGKTQRVYEADVTTCNNLEK
ncbi:virulence-associated E family protein [Xenorhabdus bovienii]|uniref:VapE domain-containing protein n=1 Tax=Xenorhabdus bovienii TaxID=40576 RepID=UPI00237CBC9E|nr:VapE domain-containing protein [Xenorhabdus bovienii]MDE1486769.1 virulence-associated E family protein [Xenorhabdus bovienii]MDE9477321.1 virulence-associated E family protein [Xenorhabdus bovienii]MDE9530201.1 virulence-associated E family protein [Xenorhabdus bovienii]